MIAGQAKTLLFGTLRHFTLSTPRVESGVPALGDAERLVLTFASDLGEFTLHARLPV